MPKTKKRKRVVCCMQKVRCKGHRARFGILRDDRYKQWWSAIDTGSGEVGIFVKEKISGNVVEARRKSDQWHLC